MKPRVLWIIPNLDYGGAQRALAAVTLALRDEFESHVAVFNLSTGQAFALEAEVHDLGVPGGRSLMTKVLRFSDRVRRVRNLKRKLGVASSVSFLEGADYVNVLSGGPGSVICSIRGSKLDDVEIAGPTGWLRKRVLMQATYRRADFVVTVSSGLRDQMRESFGVGAHHSVFIPNMYDIGEIRAAGDAEIGEGWQWVGERPLVVAHGRLHVAKNYGGLIRSFARVPRGRARLVVVGEGPERSALLTEARALGLVVAEKADPPDRGAVDVVFAGFQPNPMPWLRRATVYVLSSDYEGFPNSLAEAMVQGCPVVAADCPTGPRELLSPGSGNARVLTEAEWAPFGVLLPKLVNQSAELVWSDTLVRFLSDEGLRQRMGGAARSRIGDFSVGAVRERWARLLRGEPAVEP